MLKSCLLSSVVLTVFVFLVLISPAYALSCRAVSNEEVYNSADFIFIGEVLSVENPKVEFPYANAKIISFKMKESWKNVDSPELEIAEVFMESDAKSRFQVAQTYLVFATQDKKSGMAIVRGCNEVITLGSGYNILSMLYHKAIPSTWNGFEKQNNTIESLDPKKERYKKCMQGVVDGAFDKTQCIQFR